MLELGSHAREAHERAGRLAKSLGFERCYGLGRWADHVAAAFGEGARCFANSTAVLQALRDDLQAAKRDCGVLIKGSRAMGLDRVTAGLLEQMVPHAS
jgi:UDP-N-acetylmuramyl pentapeptide synthase